MITPETYAQYKRDGYIALPEFLSPSELDYLKERYTDVYEKQNAEGKTHNVVAVASGSTTMQNLQIHYMGLLDDGILAFWYSQKLLDAVQEIIGPDISLFFEQGFWKPPLHGAPTDWHQDNAYFELEPASAGVGFWLALDAATRDNGCMWVVPGSQNRPVEHTADENTDHLLHAVVEDADTLPIELPAGGAMLFDFATLHTTKANTTNTNRRALAMHFNRTSAPSRRPMWSERRIQERPVLRGEGSTGGVREFGREIAGEWERLT